MIEVVVSVTTLIVAACVAKLWHQGAKVKRDAAAQRRRYESLYNAAATSLWVVDLSGLHDRFIGKGIKDSSSLERFLSRSDQANLDLQGLFRVKEVNWASVELFLARDREALRRHINQVCVINSIKVCNLNSRGIRGGVWNLDFEVSLPDCQGQQLALWVNAALPIAVAGFDDVLVTLLDITDRHHMERRLEETEGFWKQIVQSVPDLVYINHQGAKQIRYANRELGQMLGYDSREVASWGQHYWNRLVHPDDRSILDGALRSVVHLADHEVMETRFRMRHKSGQWRWIYFRNSVFERYPNGTVREYLGLGRDITAEYEAKRKIEQSEEHYRLLAENMTDVVWTTDRNFCLTYVSPSVNRVLGFDTSALLGRKMFELFSDNNIQDFRQAVRKHIRAHRKKIESDNVFLAKDVYNAETEAMCRDGSTILVELNLSFLLDGHGRIQGIMGGCRDITLRRKAEQELRLTAGVFENSSEAIVITDATGQVLRANNAFTCVTGHALTEVEGRPLQVVLGVNNPRVVDDMKWHLQDHGFWQDEITLIRKDSEQYPAWMGMTAIHDEQHQVVNYIAIFSDISERKESEEAIHRLAYFDELTGLSNRTLMMSELDLFVDRCSRGDQVFALIYLDLDRFKPVNDSLGHAAGDELLKDVALRLKRCVREGDLVARMGGDEFTILLGAMGSVEVARRVAANVARKILNEFELPFSILGRELFISSSIGIALFTEDGLAAAELLKNADTAMYHAKSKGRNNYQFYYSEMNSKAMERLELENELRRAIELGQLVLEYQPQMSALTLNMVGMETLLRWHHPERGLLHPGQFIDIAEESGLIVNIGQWVIHEACRQLSQWQAKGVQVDRIAVNLSARQLQEDTELLTTIRKAIIQTGIHPSSLELEITESMMMEDVDSILELLGDLKKLGVRISVDDFGTGYSSLSYLRQFPIDALKIDKSFITSLPGASNDEQIVRAIVAIAHSLDLGVIAEGVENESQQAFLSKLGCEEVQGFLFSKALPPDQIADWLGTRSVKIQQYSLLH